MYFDVFLSLTFIYWWQKILLNLFFKIYTIILSSRHKNNNLWNLEHYGHKPQKNTPFSRLFSDFQKWTFINVQNPFPFWTFVFTLWLRKIPNIFIFILLRYMIIKVSMIKYAHISTIPRFFLFPPLPYYFHCDETFFIVLLFVC